MKSLRFWTFSLLLLTFRNDERTVTGQETTFTSTTTPAPPSNTNGTTAAECERNNNCCVQYTWPSNVHLAEGDDNAPRICEDLPDRQRDRTGTTMACFDPLIYSTSEFGERPDPQLAINECVDKEHPCFCKPVADGACLKITFINDNAAKTTVNETRFCGTLTNVGTGTFVTSGCYQEKILGTAYIREVCACELTPEGYCNTASSSIFISSIFLFMSLLVRYLH